MANSVIPSPALRYPDYSNAIATGQCNESQSSTFSYAIPQDGWIHITLQKRTLGFVNARINGSSVVVCYCNNTGIGMVEMVDALIPVKKGDILTFDYATTDETVQYYTFFGLR